MARQPPAIGIDLGTTYCCVAVWKNGKMEVLENSHGNRTTPSLVSFTAEECLVGEPAKIGLTRNYENTVYDAKRLIGRRFSDAVVQQEMERWPFRVVAGDGDKPMITVKFKGEKKRFSAQDISTKILDSLRQSAVERLGSNLVKDAVITVPAHFNNAQRTATKAAGADAGFNVLKVISEPSAAAIAYAVGEEAAGHMNGRRKIMVFDLGGGTCDISIIDFNAGEGNLRVIATAGDSHLGGKDFTWNLVEHCLKELKGSIPIQLERKALARLQEKCEEAKRNLSTQIEASIDIDSIHRDIDYCSTISRAKFEDINAELFAKCMALVERCMQDARTRKEDISNVILVGGSSRMTKVGEMMEGLFGAGKVCRKINPDEAIACGAAIMAAIIRGESSLRMRELVLHEVTPMSLGIEIVGGLMSVLVPRNTRVPVTCDKCFTTSRDNQELIEFTVYEGEETLARKNNVLGSFTLGGIRRARKLDVKITVSFEVNADSILMVKAKDPATGMMSELVITREDGWSNDETASTSDRAITPREKLVSYVDDLQVLLNDNRLRWKSEGKKKMDGEINAVRRWLQFTDLVSMDECVKTMEELEKTWSTFLTQSKGDWNLRKYLPFVGRRLL